MLQALLVVLHQQHYFVAASKQQDAFLIFMKSFEINGANQPNSCSCLNGHWKTVKKNHDQKPSFFWLADLNLLFVVSLYKYVLSKIVFNFVVFAWSRTLTFQKILFYLIHWKPFENDEKCFLFHLKDTLKIFDDLKNKQKSV